MESCITKTEPVLDAEARLVNGQDDVQPDQAETSIAMLVPTDNEDDDCVICYLTLHRPALTECGHTACENCLLHWSLSAMDMKATKEIPSNLGLSINSIKFKCPTCRTYTSASFNVERDAALRLKYPNEYAERDIKAAESSQDNTQTLVLLHGNSHRSIETEIDEDSGLKLKHEFTYFVQSSRSDSIEKVEVVLHPRYRQNRLVKLTEPPFSTTHKAFGYFMLFAGVTLKEGWEWVDEALAVDSDTEKGRRKDKLPLRWSLEFEGDGGQETKFMKVRRTKGKDENVEEEEEDDLGPLAVLMSPKEIEMLRETRREKKRAMKGQ